MLDYALYIFLVIQLLKREIKYQQVIVSKKKDKHLDEIEFTL